MPLPFPHGSGIGHLGRDMTSRELDKVVSVATDYINARDNFLAQHRLKASGVSKSSLGGPFAFDALVTQHAVSLAASLPPMNQDQWEGLAQLANSYLAHIRMTMVKKGTLGG